MTSADVIQYVFAPVAGLAIVVLGKVIVSVVLGWGEEGETKQKIIEATGDAFRIGWRRRKTDS